MTWPHPPDHPPVTPAPTGTILEPGRNCWRLDRAHRFSCIQDAADYFRLVREALLAARHTVFILGWDITGMIDLDPGAEDSGVPTRLDELLAYVVRRRPRLRCYILIWDYGALYTLERDPLSRWRLGWRMPRSVRFGFDDRHPVGGCHHQKVIVVDDQLAFCGGIDLTSHRWDTSAHRSDEPRRKTPLGAAYGPYHEVQAMVSGPAAAALGVLARQRWQALGAARMPPPGDSADDLWPREVEADLTDVDVAVARTVPGSARQPSIRECEALFVDSIAAAQETIYIESQYFTNERLADALARRLGERRGPEVVVVSPRDCQGWLERTTMGAFREGIFRQLVAADAAGRLRLVCPRASRTPDVMTFVHSKVMIVDDTLVRIGSANISRRSMGVDTECDLAVAADGNAAVRAGIRRIRDRLIGEHLGMPAPAVSRAIREAGSLGALIDACEGAEHTLIRIVLPADASDPPPPGLVAAADPDAPIDLGGSIGRLVPPVDAASERSPLRIWIAPGVALAGAVALAWASARRADWQTVRDLLAAIPATPPALGTTVGLFVLAGLALVPLEMAAIGAGLLLGAAYGGLAALAGSLLLAVFGYVAGRSMGSDAVRRWMSRRSYRSIRQFSASGVTGIIVLRLTTVASAGAVNLLAGAGQVPFVTYLAGTAIGLAPVMGALVGLGALLRWTLLEPSAARALATAGAGLLLLACAAALRTFLVIRQFSPSVSRHRDRAEFG